MLEQDIKKIMISHDEIVVAARELGQKLTVDYQGKNPIKRFCAFYGRINQAYWYTYWAWFYVGF